MEITAGVGPELASSLETSAEVIDLPRIRERRGAAIGFIRLHLALLKKRPQVIHFNFPPTAIHWVFFVILSKILISLRILRSQVVYSLHGGVLNENTAPGIQNKFFRIWCRSVFDIIVANSPLFADLLVNEYGVARRKVVQIPNGVDFHKFQVEPKKQLLGNPSILYVGKLEPVKGVSLLAEMMKYASQACPDAHLYVAGDGSLKKSLVKMFSERALESNVSFLGYVPWNLLPELYAEADLCIMPSLSENFPITALEAMAAGKPLVVSNCGNLPKLVKHMRNGIVCEASGLNLANGIIILWHDERLRKSMSIHNRKTAEMYDWKYIIPQYARLYLSAQHDPQEEKRLTHTIVTIPPESNV